MKIVEDINKLLSEAAHFLGQIPIIVWIGIGLGIVAGVLYFIYRIINMIKKVKNFKAVDVLDSMEDKIQCKIDFVEKIIVSPDKRKEKRR